MRFTDRQRRRLAVKAKAIGRKRLFEIGTLVTPDTLFRWHRELTAKKYDGSQSRTPGRPRTDADIEKLVVRHEGLGRVLNYYERRAAWMVARVFAQCDHIARCILPGLAANCGTNYSAGFGLPSNVDR
jgi:hypothetical protein